MTMTTEELLEEALRDVRQQNALHINRLRAIGAAAFTITIAVNVQVLEAGSWASVLKPTSAYFLLAVALLVGSEVSPRILRASRFSIPVFDMPMVFVAQLINLKVAATPGHVSEFTIALFVCLLLLSGLTLNSNQIYLSLGFAILFEQILQNEANMGTGSKISSTIVFGITAWICVFAGRNRISLVKALTHGDARRRRLQRYFSPGVGEILEEQEADELALGQECELTVIFTDIRGFTALSQSLPSRKIVQLLNTCHALMVEVIFRHGGTLDKYLGDGLMAYFNAPVGQPDHAARAVRCALEMQCDLAALNAERKRAGETPLEVVISIHTGRAIVGDIGAPHRREFTAIGDAVNVASRLEAMTKKLGVHILASEATAKLTPAEGSWKDVGEFPIRGCPEPLRLYSLEQRPD